MKIFYDGEAKQVNVLDERFYQSQKLPGIYFPGVTTILEAYYKGYGFHEWLKQVGFNADELLKKAGEEGSFIHNMIYDYLSGIEINWLDKDGKANFDLKIWQMFCKFIEFYTLFKPEKISAEFSMVSENLRFGGTVDYICRLNNKIYLIDYKSSNYLHKTHELQVAAYAMMWNELNPQYKIDRTAILWLKALTRGQDKKGKNIQGSGWQLKEFERPYEDAFKLFQHTQAIWEEENPNYKPKNLIYPASFKLEIK